MDHLRVLKGVAEPIGEGIQIDDDLKVTIQNSTELRGGIEELVRVAVLGKDPEKSLARWLIRTCAVHSGAIPASIHNLYVARGRGEVRDDFTVPAINLRAISYYAARAVFKAAEEIDARALIFEIARSEIGYTDQRPGEYASCILGAAVAEGFQGPVFIQGDHFQVSASRHIKDPESELETIRSLCKEAVDAGFYNIDIDTSTLVDLNQPTVPEQQMTNYSLSAELAAYVRKLEPAGVTVSVGGEIGEVGGQNSTEPELRAYMEGFNNTISKLLPEAVGLSKISIQTGTSHGGVVLPDGSIAQVKVDFDTIEKLGQVAKEYEMGGVVQHGASTLPQEAFSRFVDSKALEVHLATNFQNILYDRIPDELKSEIYAYLRENHSDERKPDQTDEQFYYKTRKRAIGPFKDHLWNIPPEVREPIKTAWEDQFRFLFNQLNIRGTRQEVENLIKPIPILPPLEQYSTISAGEDDVSDLAD